MAECPGDGTCGGHGHCLDGACVCTDAGWSGVTCENSTRMMFVYTCLGAAAFTIFLIALIFWSYRLAKAHKRRLAWTPLRCSSRAVQKPANILAALTLAVQCIQLVAFSFNREVPWPPAFSTTKSSFKLTLFDITSGYWAFRILFWCSVVWAMLFIVVLGPYLLTCKCCCGGRWAAAAVQRERILRDERRRQRHQHRSSSTYRNARSEDGGAQAVPDSDLLEREESHSRMGSALHRGNKETGERPMTLAEVFIEKDWCLGVLMTASPVFVHVTGFVWIPVVRLLLETLNCNFDAVGVPAYVILDNSMECYSTTHLRYVIVAAVTLGLFLPLSFRILPLTKTEFNPSLDLRFKQTFNVRLLAAQLFLCGISTFASRWVYVSLVFVILLSLYLLVVTWRLPPTRFKGVNDFMRVSYFVSFSFASISLFNWWYGVGTILPTAITLAVVAVVVMTYAFRQSFICCRRGCKCWCCASVSPGEDTRLTEDSLVRNAHGGSASAGSAFAEVESSAAEAALPEPDSDEEKMPAIDLDVDPGDAGLAEDDQISQIFRSYDVEGNEITNTTPAPAARRQAALPPVTRGAASVSAASPIARPTFMASSRAVQPPSAAGVLFTPYTQASQSSVIASARRGVASPPDLTNQIAPISQKWAQALLDIENSASPDVVAPLPVAPPPVPPQYSSDASLPPPVRSHYQTFN